MIVIGASPSIVSSKNVYRDVEAMVKYMSRPQSLVSLVFHFILIFCQCSLLSTTCDTLHYKYDHHEKLQRAVVSTCSRCSAPSSRLRCLCRRWNRRVPSATSQPEPSTLANTQVDSDCSQVVSATNKTAQQSLYLIGTRPYEVLGIYRLSSEL